MQDKYKLLILIVLISLTISSLDSSPISLALANTNPDIRDKISSIQILPDERFHKFCDNPLAVGCTWQFWDKSSGKLKYTRIWISDNSPHINKTIYHELGHVKFALISNKKIFNVDEGERFANNYSQIYAPNC